MARINGVIEARREAREANMGGVGVCLVRIEMARERVQKAASLPNLSGLLIPADQELDWVVSWLRRKQADLDAADGCAHSSSPVPPAR